MGFFSKPDIPRLQRERNVPELLKALRYLWDEDIHVQAANALGDMRATEAVATLAEYADQPIVPEKDRKAMIDALGAIGGDQASAALERLLVSTNRKAATMARQALDRMGTPEAQQALANIEKRQNVLQQLETAAGTEVHLAVQLELPTGGAYFAGKVVAGLLTGGVGAVTQDILDLAESIKLPEKCALCGVLPGTDEVSAAYFTFQAASAATALVGVQSTMRGLLRYRVCGRCKRSPLHEKAMACHSLTRDKDQGWVLGLRVLNQEVAKELRSLNTVA